MAAFEFDAFDSEAFDVDGIPFPIAGVDVPDHVLEAIARLPKQFRKPRIEDLLRCFVGPSQAIESAAWQLLTQRFITTAIGAELDRIGRIVGQSRDGLGDDDYRRFIRARVAAHRSRGTTEDLIKIASLVLLDEADDVTIQVVTQGPAAVQVTLAGDALTDSVAAIVVSFLRDAVAAGVRLILVTLPGADGALFTTGYTVFAHLPISIGHTLITADYPDGDGRDLLATFPSPGQLVIDAGTADEETVTYNSAVLDPFDSARISFALQTGCTHAHLTSAPVQLASGPGAGWGDSSETGHPVLTDYTDVGTTGGRMTDARE